MMVQAQCHGVFRCSDEILTRIWRVGQESFERSTQYIASPSARQERIRKQGWKKVRITALVQGYLTSDQTLRRRDICEAIPEGIFSDDSLHWLMAATDYYHCTGDVRFILEIFPTVKRVLGQLNEQRAMDGLLDSDGQEVAALNSFCVGVLRNVVEIAQAVGDHTTAEMCREKAEAIEAAICRYLWDGEQGLYRDTLEGGRISQYANALAIMFDIAPREHRVAMILAMFDKAVPDLIRAMTPLDVFYLLGALYHARDEMRALCVLQRYGEAGEWLGEEEESFLSISPWPLCYLSAEVLGVQLERPGYTMARIAPSPAGLLWAEGCVPTLYGGIEAQWERREDDQGFGVETNLPWNIGGLIGIPRLKMKYPRIILNDEMVWSNEKLHPNEQTMTVIANHERIWFEVKGGKVYRFEAEG